MKKEKTAFKLTDAFMVSGVSGAIVPIIDNTKSTQDTFRPFRLFDFTPDSVKDFELKQNTLTLYCGDMLDLSEARLDIKFDGDKQSQELINAGIQSGKFSINCLNDKGICVITANEAVDKDISIKGIYLNSEGQPVTPEYMGDLFAESDNNSFKPYGDELALNDEFYIGHKNYLNKKGAKITVTFKLDFEKIAKKSEPDVPKEKFKIIMRESKNTWVNATETWIEDAVFEYFNGLEWKELKLDKNYDNIFASADKAGEYSISFRCPNDISEVNIGKYAGIAFRIRIAKTTEGTDLSSVKNVPVLKAVGIAYSYSDNWQMPERAIVSSGISEKEITENLKKGDKVVIFSKESYSENALYLGFDTKPENEQVSLYFDIADNLNLESSKLNYEYSTLNGMKPLQIIDNTYSLSTSGTMIFTPPVDFTAEDYAGRTRYWIRISLQKEYKDNKNNQLINNICLNADEVIESYNNGIEPYETADESDNNIVYGRHRLISSRDYEREIKRLSSNIEQVSCIVGTLKDGSIDEDKLNIVVFMKNYNNNSYAFFKEQSYLYEHIRDKCELAILPEDINIVEPIFAKISVEMWLKVNDIADSFNVKASFEKCLNQFLEPIAEKEDERGWKIGELPHENQIIMRLNALRTNAEIQHISMTAVYRDVKGLHETSLESLMGNPYVVCCNGQHEIHID